MERGRGGDGNRCWMLKSGQLGSGKGMGISPHDVSGVEGEGIFDLKGVKEGEEGRKMKGTRNWEGE